MIPARQLTPHEYLQEFPPGVRPPFPSAHLPSNGHGSTCPYNIINDVPSAAKSFLIYKDTVLKEYEGESTLPFLRATSSNTIMSWKAWRLSWRRLALANPSSPTCLFVQKICAKYLETTSRKSWKSSKSSWDNIFNMRLMSRYWAWESLRSPLKSILSSNPIVMVAPVLQPRGLFKQIHLSCLLLHIVLDEVRIQKQRRTISLTLSRL